MRGLRVLVSNNGAKTAGQDESIYYYNGVWPATGSFAWSVRLGMRRRGLDLHRIACAAVADSAVYNNSVGYRCL
jgi:hypothetical protein